MCSRDKYNILIILATVVQACFSNFYQSTIIPILVNFLYTSLLTFFANNNIIW